MKSAETRHFAVSYQIPDIFFCRSFSTDSDISQCCPAGGAHTQFVPLGEALCPEGFVHFNISTDGVVMMSENRVE